jgi:hypothetical protein
MKSMILTLPLRAVVTSNSNRYVLKQRFKKCLTIETMFHIVIRN